MRTRTYCMADVRSKKNLTNLAQRVAKTITEEMAQHLKDHPGFDGSFVVTSEFVSDFHKEPAL